MTPTEGVAAGRTLVVDAPVTGPWSLATSRVFWEGFAPAALPRGAGGEDRLTTTFLCEADWSTAVAVVTQRGSTAHVEVTGSGDLEAAARQVARFLSLDVDARGWSGIGRRDPVVAAAQRALPGLRPCGFHSPYEAAAWAVLSQRVRSTQAAALRADIVRRHGQDGTLPTPQRLRALELGLPGRKAEYLHAVAGAALDGLLDGPTLRALDPDDAITRVQQVKGLGPFAAELVVLRGANAPDGLPRHERRVGEQVTERYGVGATLAEVSEAWRPYRTWAAVHLRAMSERSRDTRGSRAAPGAARLPDESPPWDRERRPPTSTGPVGRRPGGRSVDIAGQCHLVQPSV